MHDNLFHINIGQNDYIQFVFKKKKAFLLILVQSVSLFTYLSIQSKAKYVDICSLEPCKLYNLLICYLKPKLKTLPYIKSSFF